MRKIKAKEPRLAKGQPIIFVPSQMVKYMLEQKLWEEHYTANKAAIDAATWNQGLLTFQSRFGRLES